MEDRPPLAVFPRSWVRVSLAAGVLLGLAAVLGSGVSAFTAKDSHEAFQALKVQLSDQAAELDDQRDQNEQLQAQLDCRYVLSAEVNRLQADIFVTVAQALAATRRADEGSVDLYVTRLDELSVSLQEAADRRANAITVCEDEAPPPGH